MPRLRMPPSSSPSRKPALPRLADRLELGESGLSVSPICLGMVDDPATIPAAFDAGINFFFLSADMHWPLYEASRRGLAELLARGGGVRDRLVVAATCYVTQPEFCEAPLEEVVQSVPGLDRIDVGVMGGAYFADFFARLPVFQRHAETHFCGIRGLAASFHDRAAALTAAQHALLDLAFVRFNAAHPGAQVDLLPKLPAPRRTRIFNFKSTSGYVSPAACEQLGLAADAWHPHPTDHYRYALGQPGMDGALLSLDAPAQVPQLADALARGPLSADEERYLTRLTEMALAAFGEG